MSGDDGKVTVVGIDEAGYGPLLGPLVVSAVVFRAPRELADGNWWTALKPAVAAKPKAKQPRLVVCDSKMLSSRDDGLKWLERGVLSFVSAPDGAGEKRGVPASLCAFLRQVNSDVLPAMDGYPWYCGADANLPYANSADDIVLQRNALGAALASAGIEFVCGFSEVLLEGHYNRLVNSTHNKAVVLFGQTIRLVHRASQTCGGDMVVYIDKQGGRQSYGHALMRAFDDAQLEILEETDTRSGYRLVRTPGPWEVRFCQEGEKCHLPIALASMFSKYLREMFMELFNRYWLARVPGVAPTAGYRGDAYRFLKQIEPGLRETRVDRALLIRDK